MQIIAKTLVAVVALLHVGFFYLEAFLWKTPKGMAIFKLTQTQAQDSAILAANQGVYNGLLAVGLIVALFLKPESGYPIITFILLFIVGVGIFGAVTVSPRILLLQALPAALALVALRFSCSS